MSNRALTILVFLLVSVLSLTALGLVWCVRDAVARPPINFPIIPKSATQ